jgi:hypothetical protein
MPQLSVVLNVDPHWLLTGEYREGDFGTAVAKLDALDVSLAQAVTIATATWAEVRKDLAAISKDVASVAKWIAAVDRRLELIERRGEQLLDLNGEGAKQSRPRRTSTRA